MFANPFGFDPSKLDPKTLMEVSNLVRELPPEKLSKMQTLMHNMMAGYNVQQEMMEFEQSLPAGFRERLTAVMLRGMNTAAAPEAAPSPAAAVEEAQVVTGAEGAVDMSVRDARLTVLRAVADGSMDPEEALTALWPQG
jgi:hypothetical protein